MSQISLEQPTAACNNTAELENNLCGQLLNNPDKLLKITFLDVSDFYNGFNRSLFEHIRHDYHEDGSIDIDILASKLDRKSIFTLFGEYSSPRPIVPVAKRIKEMSDQRKLYALCEKTMNNIHNGADEDVYSIVEKFNETIMGDEKAEGNLPIKSFADVCKTNIEKLQEDVIHYPTGIAPIDYTMEGGMQTSRLYVVGAPTGGGKTMLKGTIARNLMKKKDKFLYIAIEMGVDRINQRILANILNENANAFNRKRKDKDFLDKVIRASTMDSSMFYVDAPGLTLTQLKSLVARAKRYQGIKGFFVDYLSLVRGAYFNKNPVTDLDMVSQELHNLCKKHDVWCFTSVQINREADFRGGDGPANAADWAYRMYNLGLREVDQCSPLYLECKKNRDGIPCGIGTKENPMLKINSTGTSIVVDERFNYSM